MVKAKSIINKSNAAETSEKIQNEEERGTKYFLIGAGILLVIIAALVIVPRFFDNELLTLEDYHKANMAGKELDNAYMYNGYSFVKYDGLWYTQIFNQYMGVQYDIPLHYGPNDVTDVVVVGDLNTFFSLIRRNTIDAGYETQTYLTFDPDSAEMAYVALGTGELTQNLAKTLNLAFIPACTKKHEQCKEVKIVTCQSTREPVIYLKQGEETVVTAQGNCITIQGTKEDLVRAVDRFLYKLYNVMN